MKERAVKTFRGRSSFPQEQDLYGVSRQKYDNRDIGIKATPIYFYVDLGLVLLNLEVFFCHPKGFYKKLRGIHAKQPRIL
jgi:hypothetical protein